MYAQTERLLEELKSFHGREERLRRIMRYSMYSVMFYRSSVYAHEKRVAWLVESQAPLLEKSFLTFDVRRSIALALIHDDPEIVTGDTQAGYKRQMREGELEALEEEERAAIDKLAQESPKTLSGYSYRDLLLEILELTSTEARVAKYLDRFDAFGEALHDIYAGNSVLTVSVVTDKGPIPIPPHFYREALPVMQMKFKELGALKDTHLFFSEPIVVEKLTPRSVFPQ